MNVTCPACGGSGDRNGNLRASDPFGTCPGCDGRGIRESRVPFTTRTRTASARSPGIRPDGDPEPAPDVDNRLTSDEVVAAAEAVMIPLLHDKLAFNERAYGKAWTGEYADSEFIARGAAAAAIAAAVAAVRGAAPSPPDTGPDGSTGSPLASPHGQNEALRSSPTTLEVDDDR